MKPSEALKTLKKLQKWFLKYSDYYKAITVAISALEKQEQTKEAIPHRNYQYLSDYWCECGWHLGKKGDMIVYCDADDCKWNEEGKCKGPVQPAGHTALYIRQNWHGWQQCDDFKDKAEEEL